MTHYAQIWWEHYPQLGMVIPNKWSDFESFWYKVSIKVFFEFQNDQIIFYQNDFIKCPIAMEPMPS